MSHPACRTEVREDEDQPRAGGGNAFGEAQGHIYGYGVGGSGLSGPSGGLAVTGVFFESGARTFGHRHTGGQVLFVTHGRGYGRSRDGSGGVIASGDIVSIAPGEEHWHGATGETYLVHIAITLGKTEWLAEVSREEYAR